MKNILLLSIMLCSFVLLQAQQKENNLAIEWCGYNQKSAGATSLNVFRSWLDKNCEVKVLDVTGKPLAVKHLKIDFAKKNTNLVSVQNEGAILSDATKQQLLQMENGSMIYIEATTEQLQKAILAIMISK
jgi:hypothetical protein